MYGVSGPAGSGKSVIAMSLLKHCAAMGFQLVGGDSYFRGGEGSLKPYVNDSWEEYDWQRLEEEVVRPWHNGESGIYTPTDWTTDQAGEPVTIDPDRPVIIDCVGLFTPERLAWFTGARVWNDYPIEEAARAGMQRTESEYWPTWAATDVQYNLRYNPKRLATFVFNRIAAEIHR